MRGQLAGNGRRVVRRSPLDSVAMKFAPRDGGVSFFGRMPPGIYQVMAPESELLQQGLDVPYGTNQYMGAFYVDGVPGPSYYEDTRRSTQAMVNGYLFTKYRSGLAVGPTARSKVKWPAEKHGDDGYDLLDSDPAFVAVAQGFLTSSGTIVSSAFESNENCLIIVVSPDKTPVVAKTVDGHTWSAVQELTHSESSGSEFYFDQVIWTGYRWVVFSFSLDNGKHLYFESFDDGETWQEGSTTAHVETGALTVGVPFDGDGVQAWTYVANQQDDDLIDPIQLFHVSVDGGSTWTNYTLGDLTGPYEPDWFHVISGGGNYTGHVMGTLDGKLAVLVWTGPKSDPSAVGEFVYSEFNVATQAWDLQPLARRDINVDGLSVARLPIYEERYQLITLRQMHDGALRGVGRDSIVSITKDGGGANVSMVRPQIGLYADAYAYSVGRTFGTNLSHLEGA